MLPAIIKTNATKKSALSRALQRFTARREERQRITSLGFLIDATASREASWEAAQASQAKMFRATAKLGALSIRLLHFGGEQLTDHGRMTSARELAAAMASVRCAGGYTQILPGLSVFLRDPPEGRADAIILIGDCFEESPAEAEQIALALKEAGIRVFCFLEGEDWTAEAVFRRLAELTGGRFARLGEELPLGALCEGVALLTAGGSKAVKRLENKQVRLLLLPGPARK
jgi:hypothetical protein